MPVALPVVRVSGSARAGRSSPAPAGACPAWSCAGWTSTSGCATAVAGPRRWTRRSGCSSTASHRARTCSSPT